MKVRGRPMIPRVSPKIHPQEGETWKMRKCFIYREKEELSLYVSPFHPHPPARCPYACICACT